jgi:hypothetical protein
MKPAGLKKRCEDLILPVGEYWMPRVDMRRLGRVLCFASCMFETVGDFHEIKLR